MTGITRHHSITNNLGRSITKSKNLALCRLRQAKEALSKHGPDVGKVQDGGGKKLTGASLAANVVSWRLLSSIMADQSAGATPSVCKAPILGRLVSMERTEKSIAAARMTIHPLYECSLRIERKFARNGARNCLSKKRHFA